MPRRISYDNSKIAVTKIIGRDRKLTHEFLRLESHYLFKDHFCLVPRGNEKGHVETLVGFARRNFLVPVPLRLLGGPQRPPGGGLPRRPGPAVRGKPEGKAQRLEVDRAAMLPLPAEAFHPRRVAHPRANSLSLVRFDSNDYSVPTAYAHHEVTVLGGTDEVRIVSGTEVVADTGGAGAKEEIFFDPVHYLALLERKPGALDFARPLVGWDLPAASGTSADGWRPNSAARGRGSHQGAAPAGVARCAT